MLSSHCTLFCLQYCKPAIGTRLNKPTKRLPSCLAANPKRVSLLKTQKDEVKNKLLLEKHKMERERDEKEICVEIKMRGWMPLQG